MDATAKRMQEQVGQVQDAYENGRRAMGDLAKTASEKSRKALNATDEWVHGNPWVALGIVAGIGVVLGVLIAQCVSED